MSTRSPDTHTPLRRTAEDWSPERVARFWNWYASQPHLANEYFSKHWAASITALIDLAGKTRGKVLDYGCGPGFLLDAFVSRGISCAGVDFSPEAVSMVNARLKHHTCFRGAETATGLPTPYQDASFDAIVCVEVVEHLSSELIDSTFRELYRLVKPGGIVIVTTPNAEDLAGNAVYCPFCNSEFHRMQHMQSLSASVLAEILMSNGFRVEFCQAVNMADFDPPALGLRTASLSAVYRWMKINAVRVVDAVRSVPPSRKLQLVSSKGAHLTAFATRPVEPPCAE